MRFPIGETGLQQIPGVDADCLPTSCNYSGLLGESSPLFASYLISRYYKPTVACRCLPDESSRLYYGFTIARLWLNAPNSGSETDEEQLAAFHVLGQGYLNSYSPKCQKFFAKINSILRAEYKKGVKRIVSFAHPVKRNAVSPTHDVLHHAMRDPAISSLAVSGIQPQVSAGNPTDPEGFMICGETRSQLLGMDSRPCHNHW